MRNSRLWKCRAALARLSRGGWFVIACEGQLPLIAKSRQALPNLDDTHPTKNAPLFRSDSRRAPYNHRSRILRRERETITRNPNALNTRYSPPIYPIIREREGISYSGQYFCGVHQMAVTLAQCRFPTPRLFPFVRVAPMRNEYKVARFYGGVRIVGR